MITYYINQNGTIIGDTDRDRLERTLAIAQLDLPIMETEDIIVDGKILTQEEYDQMQAQKERERLDNLYVTRGDMFEALLLSNHITKNQIKDMIEQYITDELQRELMLNRFNEALHYYRDYPIFDLLGYHVGITPKQWDLYFDNATKEETKDTAWRYLKTFTVTVNTIPENALVNGKAEKVLEVPINSNITIHVTADGYYPQTKATRDINQDITMNFELEPLDQENNPPDQVGKTKEKMFKDIEQGNDLK